MTNEAAELIPLLCFNSVAASTIALVITKRDFSLSGCEERPRRIIFVVVKCLTP